MMQPTTNTHEANEVEEGKAGGCCGGGGCKTEGKSEGKAKEGGCCGGSGKSTLYAVAPKDATKEQIALMAIPDLVRRYRLGVENFDRRVFALEDEQLDMAFLPEAGVGTWPIRVLLGHIADCELVYAHRLRRTVAEENPVLAVFDENALIDQNLYGLQREAGERAPDFASTGAMIAVTHVVRQWTGDWMRTLEPAAWERIALHPEAGPQSVKDLAVKAVWHLEHHARFLAKKLDRMLGPASKEGCCGGGGTSGGCGCKG